MHWFHWFSFGLFHNRQNQSCVSETDGRRYEQSQGNQGEGYREHGEEENTYQRDGLGRQRKEESVPENVDILPSGALPNVGAGEDPQHSLHNTVNAEQVSGYLSTMNPVDQLPSSPLNGYQNMASFQEEDRPTVTGRLQGILGPEQRYNVSPYHGSNRADPATSTPQSEYVFNIFIAEPGIDDIAQKTERRLLRRLLLSFRSINNFIADDIVSRLHLDLRPYKDQAYNGADSTVQIPSGLSGSSSTQILPLGVVEARWLILDDRLTDARPLTREFTTFFYVIHTNLFDVLLGRSAFEEYELYRRFTGLIDAWKTVRPDNAVPSQC